jgi:hypothetical protein
VGNDVKLYFNRISNIITGLISIRESGETVLYLPLLLFT